MPVSAARWIGARDIIRVSSFHAEPNLETDQVSENTQIRVPSTWLRDLTKKITLVLPLCRAGWYNTQYALADSILWSPARKRLLGTDLPRSRGCRNQLWGKSHNYQSFEYMSNSRYIKKEQVMLCRLCGWKFVTLRKRPTLTLALPCKRCVLYLNYP